MRQHLQNAGEIVSRVTWLSAATEGSYQAATGLFENPHIIPMYLHGLGSFGIVYAETGLPGNFLWAVSAHVEKGALEELNGAEPASAPLMFWGFLELVGWWGERRRWGKQFRVVDEMNLVRRFPPVMSREKVQFVGNKTSEKAAGYHSTFSRTFWRRFTFCLFQFICWTFTFWMLHPKSLSFII